MVKNDILKHYNCPQENISVVYNGVDLTRFHPDNRGKFRAIIRKELGIPENSILILFVGSGFERKGLKALLLATQHFHTVKELLNGLGINVKLLTGSSKKKAEQAAAKETLELMGEL